MHSGIADTFPSAAGAEPADGLNERLMDPEVAVESPQAEVIILAQCAAHIAPALGRRMVRHRRQQRLDQRQW